MSPNERQIVLAQQAISHNPKLTIRAVVRLYRAPRLILGTRLKTRLKDLQSQWDSIANSRNMRGDDCSVPAARDESV